MVPSKSADSQTAPAVSVSVCVEVKVKQSRQGKGKLSQDFLTQALQGAVGASASGSTENKGLLTSQALPLSQASLGRQQAFVVSCASAAVTMLLLCCQTWILQLTAVDFAHVHKSTRGIAPYALSALACLEPGHLLSPLSCCKTPVHLSDPCGALRSLSSAVNSNTERCAAHFAVLCRTATHVDACAYTGVFLSRGTRVERDF